jgi:hypothetical protein
MVKLQYNLINIIYFLKFSLKLYPLSRSDIHYEIEILGFWQGKFESCTFQDVPANINNNCEKIDTNQRKACVMEYESSFGWAELSISCQHEGSAI